MKRVIDIDGGARHQRAVVAALDIPAQDYTPRILLDELKMLLVNLNIDVAGEVIQRRDKPDPAYMLGKGKAEESALFCKEVKADLLVCNEQLTPGQRLNLQQILGIEIWDRPFVIMKIFERRARTTEARLQIELAMCQYEIPHLKGLGRQMSRLGAGIGTRGPGETEFERHRRKLERRVRDINERLVKVRKRRTFQRYRREKAGIPTVALTGYTNSGKSTLLQQLSHGRNLYVADQLFSTLDTYVRKVELSDGHDVLVSDTVGFIRDLPPALIAAFRTTLEEISVSSLILLVLDGSMPDVMETLDVVEETLSDIGAGAIPRLIVLNKIDKIDLSLIPFLQTRLQGRSKAKVLPICALSGVGVTELLQEVEYQLFNKMAK